MSLVGMRFLFWLKLFGKFVIEVLRASPVKATGVQIPDLVGCPQNDIVSLFAGLITRDARIDFEGPAVDAAGEGFGSGDALLAEPVDYIKASHAVVAVADDRFVGVELLEIRGNRAHRDEDGAFDAALGVFPGFSHVNEDEFFAVVEALFELSC